MRAILFLVVSLVFVFGAMPVASADVTVLKKWGHSLTIDLPDRWAKKDVMTLDDGRLLAIIDDTDGDAHIMVTMGKSRQSLASWVDERADGFLDFYSEGHRPTEKSRTDGTLTSGEFEVFTRSHVYSINGRNRHVTFGYFEMEGGVKALFVIYNKGQEAPLENALLEVKAALKAG